MSANSNREAVFPTRMTLNNTKGRLKGAQTGHSLLKRKADALTKRFRTITAKIDEAKRKMGKVMQLASFSLAEVNYTVGEIGYMVQESVGTKASFTVQARQENVSGVFLPAFEANPNTEGAKGECRTMLRINRQRIEGGVTHRWSGTDLEFYALIPMSYTEFQLTGLSRGGQQIQKARETYKKALQTLVELASLQVSPLRPQEPNLLRGMSYAHIFLFPSPPLDCLCDPR